MKNLAMTGNKQNVTCTTPAAPKSGGAVRFGRLTGIAEADQQSDGTTDVDFGDETYTLTVSAAAGAIAAGDAIYYADPVAPATTPVLSNTRVGGYFFGIAIDPLTTGSATIRVKHIMQPGTGQYGYLTS
jgi:predicted RecA/RadA family phage recombinase